MKRTARMLVLFGLILLAGACHHSSSAYGENKNELSQEVERLKAENTRLAQEMEMARESEEGLKSAAEKWALLDDRFRMLKSSYQALLKAVNDHPEILPVRVDDDDPQKKPIFDAVQDIRKLVPLKENQFAVLAYAQLEQETTASIEVVYIETNGEGDDENEEIRTGSTLTIFLDKQNDKWVLRK